MSDLIERLAAIDALDKLHDKPNAWLECAAEAIEKLPSAQPEIVRCKDCKYWDRQTYNGALSSFGFCECDNMWRSLYGETTEVAHIDTDDDFFCGFAERREDG